jgi:hypothetical protein
MVSFRRYCILALTIVIGPIVVGCQVIPDRGLTCPADELIHKGLRTEPRIRFGCYPTATLGTFFLGENLGPHGYSFNPWEKNGMAYTCRAGHIDIIHLRIAADWTAYLAARSFRAMMHNDDHFTFGLAVDRSTNHVHLSYPPNWNELPAEERAVIAEEVAMALAPHLAFTMTTWHEILTWFGFKCIGLATEFPSAFSWEDSFSNLLGTIVAVRALEDTERRYDKALAIALNEEMARLGIQPASVAKRASQQVKGEWFTGSALFFVDVKRRNFDIGLDDGMVTPTLLQGVEPCAGVKSVSYPVPTLDALAEHGFSVELEIEPREWERNAILAVAYPDAETRRKRIDPSEHLPRIMDHVRRDAVERYGQEVDVHFGSSLYGVAAPHQ